MMQAPDRPRPEHPDREPAPDAPAGEWNAYVAAGASREERRARLDRCPPEHRPAVRSHVETVFALQRKGRTA
ncbi:hypothetical protein [Thioalkalivibrio sp. ALE6]|uniref:hypothetical protein n=1 Tax=Thioalkalivibrio sp. ALE6 TaxID=1266908 RepID=UPI00037C3600|nr:hypothetical protein [Thioalkalivibrio sp. ALE6]